MGGMCRPKGSHRAPLKMLLVDSWYDTYKGVILLVRLFDGLLKLGDQIVSLATKKKYFVGEVGIMHPLETATSSLRAGQVGYCYFNPGMKQTSEAKIGDTLTHVGYEKDVVPCEGFEEPQPMVASPLPPPRLPTAQTDGCRFSWGPSQQTRASLPSWTTASSSWSPTTGA